MRKLIWLIVILAALYGGYWVVGSRLLQGQIDAQIAAQRAAGLEASFAAPPKVRGFPSRFDVAAEGIDIYAPARRIGWKADWAEVTALAYSPQHYIAALSNKQVLRLPGADVDVTSSDMRASLVFDTGPSFVLNRMSFVAKDLGLVAGAPELATGANELRLSTSQDTVLERAHRIGLSADQLIVPQFFMDQLRTAAPNLPDVIERLYLDGVVAFDRQIDRHLLNGPLPQPVRLRLDDLSLDWGPVGLKLTGDLAIDGEGRASGPVKLTIRGMSEILDIAGNLGLIPSRQRPMIQSMILMLAKPDAEGRSSFDLIAKDGAITLGPVSLPLPRIRLGAG